MLDLIGRIDDAIMIEERNKIAPNIVTLPIVIKILMFNAAAVMIFQQQCLISVIGQNHLLNSAVY